MLSILIPTHNYSITTLVNTLHQQVRILNIDFEIIIFDDASVRFIEENTSINTLENCSYTVLEKNIGRSAIRNRLAKRARYDVLLFLDADTKLTSDLFIKNYIDVINSKTQIIYGGILYEKKSPSNNQTLRWTYGRKREALSLEERLKKPYLRFLTLNFLIKKSVFNIISFNENIPNMRHEDTLFAMAAKTNHVNIDHINNPVLHLGLESNSVFLKKSLESIDALKLFIQQDLISAKHIKLSQKGETIKKYKLTTIVIFGFNTFKKGILKNLYSKKPSLFLFDFYRLGYYLQNK
jgi:glycosyltransferase involved in cell wall biosynthesis